MQKNPTSPQNHFISLFFSVIRAQIKYLMTQSTTLYYFQNKHCYIISLHMYL